MHTLYSNISYICLSAETKKHKKAIATDSPTADKLPLLKTKLRTTLGGSLSGDMPHFE